jgi:outer membrane phospholipase A
LRAALVALLLAGLVAGNASADTDLLRPYWTGPVWGAFTNAGPDSIQGPRAELNVPIGVRLTNPISIAGKDVTLRARFHWTTKAYLGEDSEPLRDASYEWFPTVRVAPDSAAGFWRYAEAGPDHLSNGDEGLASRSMNAVSGEAAFVWVWYGIAFDAYVKAWYVYDYGENTAPMAETVTLAGDFGAKVLVRASLSMIQIAGELGPDWQKLLTYFPLNDFYQFGIYAEIHNGEGNSFLNPTVAGTYTKVGVALKPPTL